MAAKCDDSMTCKICHQYYDDPRLLPCSHTYCFQCIRTKASAISGDFACPMNDGTKIQRNQINSLKKNDSMREVIESLSKLNVQDELEDTDDANEQNVIFVSGLPVDIPDLKLVDILYNIFIHCGSIKVITMK